MKMHNVDQKQEKKPDNRYLKLLVLANIIIKHLGNFQKKMAKC